MQTIVRNTTHKTQITVEWDESRKSSDTKEKESWISEEEFL